MHLLKQGAYLFTSWIWLRLDWLVLVYSFRKKKNISKHSFVPVQIHYFSQFEDPLLNKKIEQRGREPIPDSLWKQSGAQSREEFFLWSDQVCAMTCLKMIASNFPSLPQPFQTIDFAKKSLSYGVYKIFESGQISGIFWEAFEQYLKEYNISSKFKEYLTISQILDFLESGHIVLVSVSPFFHHRERGNKKIGHIVLVHGYSVQGGSLKAFHIKDPAGWRENNTQERPVSITEFLNFYSGRGFVISTLSYDRQR